MSLKIYVRDEKEEPMYYLYTYIILIKQLYK